jgi:hypothetical protein
MFTVPNISCSSFLNKTQDLIPFTQYYYINGLAEGTPKKMTQRFFRPWGITEHASWSLNVPWSTKRNKAFTLQPFPWHTSDLQGKGLHTKGKAFLSSKQAYLCTIINLELQAMDVATTTIFQVWDSCNYFWIKLLMSSMQELFHGGIGHDQTPKSNSSLCSMHL